MKTYDIVLADDHALFREGLKRIICEDETLSVVGEAGDGVALLRLLDRVSPDLVIIDISMPNLRGIEATKRLKKAHSSVRVLIVTMHRDKDYAYYALKAGADGYLLKEDADIELFHAIRTVREGNIYLSPLIVGEMAKVLKTVTETGSLPSEDTLSGREREVLQLIAEGRVNREIAELLYISVRTVEHHRAHIMKKLGARNTADLVRYAVKKEASPTFE